ncbi:MAG: alpha-amylase family glycosyl hydrolase [Muribaculaceae bacterium]
MNKPIIYQLLPRLFGNKCNSCIPNGTIEENGVGKMNDINDKVLASIKDLGATHVWYTGIIEHATKTDYSKYGIARDNPHIVKGNAGSPYAIKDYYDIDPDIAEDVPKRMAEFHALIKRTHHAGLKMIMDFVPNHVARQYHSDVASQGIEDLGYKDNTSRHFDQNNNFYYIPRQLFSPYIDLGFDSNAYYEFPAKATGNDCFSAFPNQNDWYETIKLNYGIDYGNNTFHFTPTPNTWFKMLNILRFWASKGIDGFRCDMAHMVPIAFWKWAIPLVKEKYPEVIFIAEIYDVALYRDYIYNGHFDYLYDKVNLYDTLRAIQCNSTSAACITNCWQTVDGISSHMLNFLENHDEQRYASRHYAGNAAHVIPALVVSATISTGPLMIYAGQELGEQAVDAEGFSGRDGRTTIFDYWSIPTLRRWLNNGECNDEHLTLHEIWLRDKYRTILNLCNQEKAISEGTFFDLMYVNYENPTLSPHHQYTYLRKHDNEIIIVAVNFDNKECALKINIPRHAFDVLNIKQGEYNVIELLSGTKSSSFIKVGNTFDVEIEPHNAVICKLKPKKEKVSSKKIEKCSNKTIKKS